MNQRTAISRLGKVQKLAFLCATEAMRSTHTAGLEGLLNLIPLNVAVKKEAAIQVIPTRIKEKFKAGNLTGHLAIIKRIGDILSVSQASDHTGPIHYFVRRYRVHFPMKEEWRTDPRWLQDGSKQWYADGFKMIHGIGAAIVGPRTHRAITLSRDTTIIQADINVIPKAVTILSEREYNVVRIKIFSDSPSVLKALSSRTFTSSIVQITLVWFQGLRGTMVMRWRTSMQRTAFYRTYSILSIQKESSKRGGRKMDKIHHKQIGERHYWSGTLKKVSELRCQEGRIRSKTEWKRLKITGADTRRLVDL